MEKNSGFNPESFEELYNVESGNYWFVSRNKLIVWALKKYFPKTENLLEIGCGTGFVLSGIHNAFPDIKLTGSEIYSEGLKFSAKRIPDVKLYQMDARDLPFKNEFDVISAFDVLEHIEENETVLKQMYNASKAEGGIIITVPQHPFLWSATDDSACHVRRYTRKDLCKKLEAANFKIEKVTSFVSLLFPVMLL